MQLIDILHADDFHVVLIKANILQHERHEGLKEFIITVIELCSLFFFEDVHTILDRNENAFKLKFHFEKRN